MYRTSGGDTLDADIETFGDHSVDAIIVADDKVQRLLLVCRVRPTVVLFVPNLVEPQGSRIEHECQTVYERKAGMTRRRAHLTLGFESKPIARPKWIGSNLTSNGLPKLASRFVLSFQFSARGQKDKIGYTLSALQETPRLSFSSLSY